jgi:hypothetical protein
MATRIEIRTTGDLKRINRELRKVADGKQLGTDMTKASKKVLTPVAAEVKAHYLTQPAFQGRRTREGKPLHLLLAKATKVEVRRTGRLAGARVRVDGRRMPSGMRSLPAYWEGSKPRWRWPVYGDRQHWATGHARPGFDRIVEPSAPRVRREIDQVLQQVKRKLEAGR